MHDMIAAVLVNREVSPVLKEKVEYTYRKYPGLLIGQDATGTFFQVYKYERPTKYSKAFGGDKFDIQLENGEVEHCYGQWWDGGGDEAAKLLGKELVRIACGTEQGLEDCYLFYSCYADKEKLDELMSKYTGKVYEYNEYRDIMRERRMAKREVAETK